MRTKPNLSIFLNLKWRQKGIALLSSYWVGWPSQPFVNRWKPYGKFRPSSWLSIEVKKHRFNVHIRPNYMYTPQENPNFAIDHFRVVRILEIRTSHHPDMRPHTPWHTTDAEKHWLLTAYKISSEIRTSGFRVLGSGLQGTYPHKAEQSCDVKK